MNATDAKYFLITIDVEDWFQVENFKPWISFSSWDRRELRVERNIHRLLDLFDSIELPPAKRSTTGASKPIYTNNPIDATNATNTTKVRATFFVLCWVAKRLPHLVREIAARGHEVASHGCQHDLPSQIPLHSLKTELAESRNMLEDIIGKPVVGFRAPSFAIDQNVIKYAAEEGYRYDSSYNSFSLHGRYGHIELNGHRKFGIALRLSEGFYELPISNVKMLGQVLPFGGGAYFRLIPFPLFRRAVSSIVERDRAYLFYLHPWEIDPLQPRVKQASVNFRLRHYINLSKTAGRLSRLVTGFPDCCFVTCSQYLEDVTGDVHHSGEFCAANDGLTISPA